MMAAPLLGRLLSPSLFSPPSRPSPPLPLANSIELVLLPPFCSAPLSPCQLHRTCSATALLFAAPSPLLPPFPLPAPPNLSCYRPSVPQSFSPLPLASSTELVLLPSFCSAVLLPLPLPAPPNLSCYRPSVPQSLSPSSPFPLSTPPNLFCYCPSVPQPPLPFASSTELVLLPPFCSAVLLPPLFSLPSLRPPPLSPPPSLSPYGVVGSCWRRSRYLRTSSS